MQNLKERWQSLPDKTRKMIKAIAGGTAVIALIAILVLNLGNNPDYSTLFTGLNQEEAQQVVSLLQDQGIDYRYSDDNGTICVPKAFVDQTRANLLSSGYPKSGFTYDMYLNNTGLMTTESDKKQITLYDLQDRLGSTIRLFEGVQDAKVTINQAVEQRYAYGDNSGSSASAAVIVTMKNGSSLTADRAQAVKNLISHAVRGLTFTDVAVFDAATMMEVGGSSGGAASGATDLTSLTSLVESNIAANVRRVLEQLYGSGNVAVSVKGTLNMERLIQENTRYTTPDKIGQNDKTGLLQQEDLVNEDSAMTDQNAGGLVGADANADTPRYTNDNGNDAVTDNYSNSSASRTWLYDMLKEQRQIDPGVLEDTSIGIVIITQPTAENGAGTSEMPDTDAVSLESLIRLVANSSGIPVAEANDKITIIRAPGAARQVVVLPDTQGTLDRIIGIAGGLPLPVLIAIGAGILLLFLLILLLLIRGAKKRKNKVVLEGGDFMDEELSADSLSAGEEMERSSAQPAPGTPMAQVDDEFTKNEEILNLRMQRSLRLKQNIAEFVDQNPQIAAKLVQSWLRGEEGDSSGSGHRKHSK